MSPGADSPAAPPPPLESDDARTVLVITSAWVAGLVVLLALAALDVTQVRGWWLGMCGYGIALGLFGVLHLRRRGRRQAADPEER